MARRRSAAPHLALLDTLGGQDVLGKNVSDLDQLRVRVRRGLPFRALDAVSQELGLTRDETAAVIGVPKRTLARRKGEHTLASAESDRLVRLARIAALASWVLGDKARAAVWLKRPNRGLGGERPLDLTDTDLGARRVEEILGRIEHGVYS